MSKTRQQQTRRCGSQANAKSKREEEFSSHELKPFAQNGRRDLLPPNLGDQARITARCCCRPSLW
jgi:hypothetical protein